MTTNQDGSVVVGVEDAADIFWLNHPDWDICHETAHEGTCFAPMANAERAAFVRRVHALQYGSKNCSNDLQSQQINNGFGASLSVQTQTLLKAFQRGRPYQMTKHWPGMHWLYVPNDTASWAWCPTTDMNCYILPLSHCAAVYGRHNRIPSTEPIRNVTHELPWMAWYLQRFRHRVRYHVRQLLNQHFSPLPSDIQCTTMHVRRSDVGFAQMPFRRYAAVSEYLEAGQIPKGETIVLLTDDVSTLEEIQRFHANDYVWKYVNRPRPNTTANGPNGHIGSGNEAYDTAMILAELEYASRCHTLVHGDSIFVQLIQQAMLRYQDRRTGGGARPRFVYVNTTVSKKEARKFKGKRRGPLMLQQLFAQEEAKAAAKRKRGD